MGMTLGFSPLACHYAACTDPIVYPLGAEGTRESYLESQRVDSRCLDLLHVLADFAFLRVLFHLGLVGVAELGLTVCQCLLQIYQLKIGLAIQVPLNPFVADLPSAAACWVFTRAFRA